MNDILARRALVAVIAVSALVTAQTFAQSLGGCNQSAGEAEYQCVSQTPCVYWNTDVCYTLSYSCEDPPCDPDPCEGAQATNQLMTGFCFDQNMPQYSCTNCTKYWCANVTVYQSINPMNYICVGVRCNTIASRNNVCVVPM